MAFALWRAGGTSDCRPLAVIASRRWIGEQGRLFGWGASGLGLRQDRLILILADREAQVLWAMEEALKSGAVAGAVAVAQAPPFVATRRLDFAARAGRAAAVLLRPGPPGDLSAANLRWRIAAAPSAPHPFDARAPGAARIACELVRRRNGPPGAWILEQDDATGALHLAAGLADHRVVAAPSGAAA